MQFITSITEVLETLSLDNHTSITDGAAFANVIVSKVKENPKVLPRLMPKLAEQVRYFPNNVRKDFLS